MKEELNGLKQHLSPGQKDKVQSMLSDRKRIQSDISSNLKIVENDDISLNHSIL